MAVHRGRHFLPVDQGFDFISGRHKLSAFGFLKRFVNEEGVFFHFGFWKLFPYPLQMELEILENPSTGQEGAAQAGQDLPAVQVAHAAGMGHLGGLFDELAVQLVSQGRRSCPVCRMPWMIGMGSDMDSSCCRELNILMASS